MRDSELHIRSALAADADGLLPIWQETVETMTRLDSRYRIAANGAERWRASFVAGLSDPDRHTALILRGDKPIGYMVGTVQANAPGLLPEMIGVIVELSVDSHGQGGGVGTQLFATLSDWFKTRGVSHIELRVPSRNPIAQAFWRALGATSLYDQLWIKLRD